MYNGFPYNSTVYNGLGFVGELAVADSIVFNGYGLQNDSIVTQILIQDSTPERDFQTSAIPRDDGQIITGDFWRKKVIKIEGFIRKTTGPELNAELDIMKKALAVPESILDITIDGVVRRYIATLINGGNMFSDRLGYHISLCPFTLEFESEEPFGKSINYNSIGFLARTDLIFNEEVTNSGTVHAKPVVIVNLTAATSVVALSFKNNTTGEEIKVTQALNAGDYVRFDSEQTEVVVNGVIVDYLGSFPSLDTGANSFTITVTGGAVTYDLTVKHKTPYL